MPLSVIPGGGSSLEKSRGDFSMTEGVPKDFDVPVTSSMSITQLEVAVNSGTSWAARVIPADSSSSIPADNVPAGSSSSIPADYV
ncbi:hypothetical protein Tco_1048848, partial [Tanacetum coccineum]